MINGLRFIIGSSCNYDCFFCHHEGYEKISYDEVSNEKLELLKEYALEKGIKDISITGGEPFIYWNKLNKLLELFGTKDFYITLNSNLTLVDKYINELIKFNNIEYHVNFSSLKKDVHKKIINKNYLEKLKENLELFKKNNQNVCLNIPVLYGINDNELIDILKYCQDMNFKARFLVLLPMIEEHKKYFYDVDDIMKTIPNSELLRKYSYGRYDISSLLGDYEIVKCLCVDMECELCRKTTYVHITPELNFRMCMMTKEEYEVDYTNIKTIDNSFKKVIRKG